MIVTCKNYNHKFTLGGEHHNMQTVCVCAPPNYCHPLSDGNWRPTEFMSKVLKTFFIEVHVIMASRLLELACAESWVNLGKTSSAEACTCLSILWRKDECSIVARILLSTHTVVCPDVYYHSSTHPWFTVVTWPTWPVFSATSVTWPAFVIWPTPVTWPTSVSWFILITRPTSVVWTASWLDLHRCQVNTIHH